MDCVLKESKERPTIFHTSMTSIAQMFSKCHSAYEWNWETVSSLLFHNFAFFLMSFSLTIVCVCVVSVCYIGLYGLSVTQRESDMNTIDPENQNRFDFAKCTLSQKKNPMPKYENEKRKFIMTSVQTLPFAVCEHLVLVAMGGGGGQVRVKCPKGNVECLRPRFLASHISTEKWFGEKVFRRLFFLFCLAIKYVICQMMMIRTTSNW